MHNSKTAHADESFAMWNQDSAALDSLWTSLVAVLDAN